MVNEKLLSLVFPEDIAKVVNFKPFVKRYRDTHRPTLPDSMPAVRHPAALRYLKNMPFPSALHGQCLPSVCAPRGI